MKAIETTGKVNHEGGLVLDQPLDIKEKNVRVIILVAEENEYKALDNKISSTEFVDKWAGFLQHSDPDASKLDYLSNKYK